MILQLLESLPTSFDNQLDTKCATGAAMLAAKKLVVYSPSFSFSLFRKNKTSCHLKIS